VIWSLLLACSPSIDQPAVATLESFGFGWEYFNHRLSHLEVLAGPDAAQVSIIGGTSTTQQEPGELSGECVQATCNEFPFKDQSLVDLGVRVLESDRVGLVPASIFLEVGRDDVRGTLRAKLPKGAKGDGAVLLSGFSIDTSLALAQGASCYDPAFGWHPSLVRVSLGAVTVDGEEASAPVDLAFAAGNTHDPDRACIDEVNEEALVAVRVDAMFVVGKGVESADVPFEVAAAYEFTGNPTVPGDQVEPDPQSLDYGLSAEPTATGVASMEWLFYPEVYGTGDDEQGAYLRTFRFQASPDGTAAATATNYSPGTQLEGFSYEVQAVARGVVFDGDASTWETSVVLETLLDDGVPVVHEVAAP
jgi:hypothetical protein